MIYYEHGSEGTIIINPESVQYIKVLSENKFELHFSNSEKIIVDEKVKNAIVNCWDQRKSAFFKIFNGRSE